MKHLAHLSCTLLAALTLTACATQQPRQRAVWNATPGATVPQDQATAKCDYDLMQNPSAFTELSKYAGQPVLSDYGRSLYKTCMMAQGFRFGGSVPIQGATP